MSRAFSLHFSVRSFMRVSLNWFVSALYFRFLSFPSPQIGRNCVMISSSDSPVTTDSWSVMSALDWFWVSQILPKTLPRFPYPPSLVSLTWVSFLLPSKRANGRFRIVLRINSPHTLVNSPLFTISIFWSVIVYTTPLVPTVLQMPRFLRSLLSQSWSPNSLNTPLRTSSWSAPWFMSVQSIMLATSTVVVIWPLSSMASFCFAITILTPSVPLTRTMSIGLRSEYESFQ